MSQVEKFPIPSSSEQMSSSSNKRPRHDPQDINEKNGIHLDLSDMDDTFFPTSWFDPRRGKRIEMKGKRVFAR